MNQLKIAHYRIYNCLPPVLILNLIDPVNVSIYFAMQYTKFATAFMVVYERDMVCFYIYSLV